MFLYKLPRSMNLSYNGRYLIGTGVIVAASIILLPLMIDVVPIMICRRSRKEQKYRMRKYAIFLFLVERYNWRECSYLLLVFQ